MTPSISDQESPNSIKLGGWLFRHRTAVPLPIAAAILIAPSNEMPPRLLTILAGVALTAGGEALRLWGVHHIGAISRTRSDRLGPLIDTGPFAYVRNPLYIGNILVWVGFAVAAGLFWLAPIVAALLAVEYHWIVRWEEQLLEVRLGAAYRDYRRRVPRWLPAAHRGGPSAVSASSAVSLRRTLFSERGTLVAIVVGYLLLIWLRTMARF